MTRATATGRPAPREMRRDAVRNREELLRAATVAVHRDGPSVPMAAIAAEAGVGVGTLYRHFPDRERLLGELTHRSFEQVLANAQTAEADAESPLDGLRRFIHAAIRQRDSLVLPLNGGPDVALSATRRVRSDAHEVIGRLVDAGQADGTIRGDVNAMDVIVFGAMLSQPGRPSTQWSATCHRLLESYLRGLRP